MSKTDPLRREDFFEAMELDKPRCPGSSHLGAALFAYLTGETKPTARQSRLDMILRFAEQSTTNAVTMSALRESVICCPKCELP